MIIQVKSRGRNTTGRSRARDRRPKYDKPSAPAIVTVIRHAGTRIMTEGQHKGKRYADIPRGYLVWMIREKCKDWRRARKEMQRRRWAAREDAANAWRRVLETEP